MLWERTGYQESIYLGCIPEAVTSRVSPEGHTGSDRCEGRTRQRRDKHGGLAICMVCWGGGSSGHQRNRKKAHGPEREGERGCSWAGEEGGTAPTARGAGQCTKISDGGQVSTIWGAGSVASWIGHGQSKDEFLFCETLWATQNISGDSMWPVGYHIKNLGFILRVTASQKQVLSKGVCDDQI